MGRLMKLSKRVAASGAMLAGASVLAQGLFASRTVQAQAAPECSSLPGTIVYVSGSSAVKPVLAGLAGTLGPAGTTIVYFSNGSCTGVAAILGTAQAATTAATYWDAGVAKTCAVTTSQPVDIGVSDVYATSCAGVTQQMVTDKSLKDYDTFFAQVMEFVVNKGSDQTAISAEAAYLTFGLGAAGETPWDNPGLFAIRDSTSGTQTMLAKAIGLDATKWVGVNTGGSGNVFLGIKNSLTPVVKAAPTAAADASKLIGILSSGEADADTVNVKKLAFQGTGQTCAFWADSGVSALDKKYVRDGHYPVWGPLHVLAKADAQGAPTNAAAKAVIDAFAKQDKAILDVEINANVVPLCAMNVTRDEEVGPLSSVQPTGACGCYFDHARKAGGVAAECIGTGGTKDQGCASDAACPSARSKCNYGFCEVK
jgi:ABC-type phosphate transport system substrate-binding protein